MLWALFAARASTLKKVQSMRQRFEQALDMAKLDCSDLNWVKKLRPLSALWDSDDGAFKEQVSQMAFPFDFKILANHPAGHGHKPDRSKVNLLEHTLDVVCGHFGGFGLNTDVTVSGMGQPQVRKVLRLAALFHDAGKVSGREGHIERSAEMAVKELYKAKDKWDVTDEEILLIKHLILSNDLYGQYLRGSSTMKHVELLKLLDEAFNTMQKDDVPQKISPQGFRKLLLALWLADASTLSIVNKERGDLYRPLHKEIDDLDYATLERIYLVKDQISKGASK